MHDIIYRQDAIDTDGLDEEIRCEMCKNPIHTDRGCNGNCKYDEILYEKIIQILDKRITPLPSAHSEHNADDERKIADLHKMVNYLLSRLESQWIPVSEGLPKEYGEYICTMENGQVQECGFVPENQRGLVDGWSTCEADGHKFLGYVDVLAWMPLPEPWKEDEA